MRALFIFLFIPFGLLAQNQGLPFELERFSTDHYLEVSEADKAAFSSESQAIQSYMNAYKTQRSLQPADYFPAPNGLRKEASAYLQSNHSDGSAAALTLFLENNGELENAAALVSRPSGNELVLPYRFLAAFLLNRSDIQKEALLEMKRQGMIHPMLIAFGENSLYSAQGSDVCITNGMQDLIAVRAAQLINGTYSEIPVYNLFAEQCTAYNGKLVQEILDDAQVKIWVSPAMNPGFLSAHQDQLWTSGIGFAYAYGPAPDQNIPIENLLQIARDFQMVVVHVKALNPSLLGIGRSYAYFDKMLTAYTPLYGSRADRKRAEEISLYLSQFQNPF